MTESATTAPTTIVSEQGEIGFRSDLLSDFNKLFERGNTKVFVGDIVDTPSKSDPACFWIPSMDKMANKEFYIESIFRRNTLINGVEYIFPRVCLCGWYFQMTWVDWPQWTQFLEDIDPSRIISPPKEESGGAGLAIGALVFAAGLAMLRAGKEKTLPSKIKKENVQQVQVLQERLK